MRRLQHPTPTTPTGTKPTVTNPLFRPRKPLTTIINQKRGVHYQGRVVFQSKKSWQRGGAPGPCLEPSRYVQRQPISAFEWPLPTNRRNLLFRLGRADPAPGESWFGGVFLGESTRKRQATAKILALRTKRCTSG